MSRQNTAFATPTKRAADLAKLFYFQEKSAIAMLGCHNVEALGKLKKDGVTKLGVHRNKHEKMGG